MIDIEYKLLNKAGSAQEVGEWLDSEMPNPPLPDEQRWTLGHSPDGRVGFRFTNDLDATLFCLRWM
jgi:hypothetical protein